MSFLGFDHCSNVLCFLPKNLLYPALEVGAVAGDAASYDTFAEFFDALVRRDGFWNGVTGSTMSTNRYMIKSTLKIARYCPLVIQGFSSF